ncbi:BIR protein [Plasmodium berghei]|uniref:BIR protein n=2 Tax=Plasmodium berghei TaxID=5821 RepID=A0A1C6WB60_PLABE|nr:BIR protein [Plasmodium berghei]
MPKDLCTIFQNVNNLFNKGELDFGAINLKHGPYIRYCPYHRESGKYECKNMYDGLNALCMHLFTELYKIPGEVIKFKSSNNEYVGYVMMWLSYRLSQITDYNDSTLLHFYKNYLTNSFINYEHMDKIKKNRYLKDANIGYMSQLYNLFNEICNLTLKYSRNPTEISPIIVGSNQIYNIHKNLYNDIKECDSYLYLLNTLKTEYEKLKKNITKNGIRDFISGKLYASIKNLIPTRRLGKYYKSGFGFEACIRENSKVKKQFPDPAPNAPKDQNPKPPSEQNRPSKSRTTITKPLQKGISRSPPPSLPKLSGVPSPLPPLPSYQPKDNELETSPAPRVLSIISLSSQKSTELQKNATEESNHKNGQESPKIKPHVSDNSERNAGDTIVDKRSSSSGSINHGGESIDQGSGNGLGDSPSITINEIGTHTDKTIVVDGNKTEENSKGNEQKDSVGNTGSKKSTSGNPIDSNKHLSTSGTNQGDSNDGLVDGPKGSTVGEGDTGNRSLNTGGGQNEQNISGGEPDGGQGGRGGSEGSEDSGGGSSSEPGVTDNVPEEKETKSTSGTFFNIRPDIFKITLKGMDQLNNTFKFFRTYKEKIINISNEIHGVYNTTLDIIKNSFDKSINVFNKIIENISFDSKKIEITDDSGDKKHGSDGTGDKSPTSDDSPPIQGNPTQENSHQEDPPKEKSPQISLTPSSNEQTRETKSSQDTPENKNYKSSREEPQKPVPAPVIKLKNSVTEVKENGTTGIDVNILKKYKPIGILIIALLAPITLLIVYKVNKIKL